MSYQEYIEPELGVVILILYAAGMTLKATPKVKDWLIPYILTGVSLILCTLWVVANNGISATAVFTAAVQSVLCVAASVYGNQIVKQFMKKDEKEGEK